MMFKAVDMDKYPRKAHFDYFNSMVYPYVGVTVLWIVTCPLMSI